MDSPAHKITPFERAALVFAVLVTFLSFLIAARFGIMESRLEHVEKFIAEDGLK